MTEPRKIDDEYASAKERLRAFLELFLLIKELIVPVQYRDHFCINEPLLTQVIGMYLDDRERIKKENDIERLHRSKVAAYLVKWILHYRPIYTTFDESMWDAMNEEHQTIALDINYIYAVHVIFHTLDEFLPQDFYPGGKFKRILDDIRTSMRTGAYNEQIAAILFDAIAAHYADQDDSADEYTC